MKAKIFIGSSKESLEYAGIVKQQLGEDYECVLWNEDFFQLNVSTYENLYRQAYGFDYAIFVGGQDSIVYERRKKKSKARDNVVFELGLYAGILSPSRSFFLLNKECKVFSDFDGITVAFYGNEQDVKDRCADMRKCIERESKISRPSILPASALATSYYNNFIVNIHKWVTQNPKFKIEDSTYDASQMNITIKVALPKWEIFKMNSIDAEFYRKKDLQQISVSYEKNKRGLYLRVDVKRLQEKELVIYDVPTALDTSFDVIDLLSGKDYWGEDDRTLLLKQKEVREFEKTLMNRTKENRWLYDRVKCIDIYNEEEQ